MPRPARLLVAVSGGSDSTGLLVALVKHLSPQLTLSAVTVDHRLRPESAVEAAAVGALCGRLGVPHRVLAWDGEKPKTGVSAAAREARYALLCQAAYDAGATAILTGHTLDDQLETVAMRAARRPGTQAPGMAGMAEATLLYRRHWLLRPLLRTSRESIRDVLRDGGHGWADDPSNIDLRYERVRTRASLASEESVAIADIDAAARRRQTHSEAAAALLGEHARVHRSVLMHVSRPALAADAAVLRYALSMAAAVLGGREQGPGSESMDRIMGAIGTGEPGRVTAGRVIFDLRREGLFLCRESRGLPETSAAPGETAVWDGRFRITNEGTRAATVKATETARQEAQDLFPDIPASIAMRAMRALPAVDMSPPTAPAPEAVPRLAPFDRFLSQFDYKLAGTLAGLFGCNEFPSPPFDI